MERAIGKILILLLLFSSCIKDQPEENKHQIVEAGAIMVVCEGQFSAGNAALFRINPQSGTSDGDLYKSANGTSAGDVLQSLYRIGANYWLLLNNSSRIAIVDTQDYRLRKVIPIHYPRYLVQISANIVWVSTLYSNKVYEIDVAAQMIVDSITVPDNNPEGMYRQGDYVYIATWDTLSDAIYKVSCIGKRVERISIGAYAPHDILEDREGKLWILSGNATKGKQAAFTRVDPSTGAKLSQCWFASGAEPIKPILNYERDSVYFIEVNFNGGTEANGIYRASLFNFSIPEKPFIQALQYQYFWALSINPANNNIFVGDPRGFNQAGMVTEYTKGGALIKQYKVGVGPGSFVY